MSPLLDGFLRSWPFEPWLVLALLLPALVYLRGWLVLHHRDPLKWTGGRLACFMGGITTLFLALASPLEPFAALLLQAHMIQHLLFMMVAPPLIWLGAPLFPIVRGLPPPVRTYWVVPLLRSMTLRRLFARLTHPIVALPLFTAVTWIWHAPPVYEYALWSSGWHSLQHLCFLGSALLFWYPVIRPYPSRPRWSPWLLIPYLIVADVQNTAPVRVADVFGPRALSALCADTATRRAVGLARPVSSRRHHVGTRINRLSVATVRDRNPAPLWRETGSPESGVACFVDLSAKDQQNVLSSAPHRV